MGEARPFRTFDLHTQHYTSLFFEAVRQSQCDYSFATAPNGQPIITLRGARFFGVTPAMTDMGLRLEAMDRYGIDVAVLSLSTPNVFFLGAGEQPALARAMNDAYAAEMAAHPDRIRAFASIPMDNPDAALHELHRALDDLKMSGVVLLSNIGGAKLTDPKYRPFFEEANRIGVCIFLHPMLPTGTQDAWSDHVLGPIVAFTFDTTLAVARMAMKACSATFPTSSGSWLTPVGRCRG